MKNSRIEILFVQEANVDDAVINSAISAFIINVIVGHGEPAPRLCNKDPFTLKSTSYLAELFPNSKFILMIRDGRATVHSIISRKITITGFDLNDFRQCLQKWNAGIQVLIVSIVALSLGKRARGCKRTKRPSINPS